MYLKKELVFILKAKNIIFKILSILLFLIYVFYFASMISVYYDRLEVLSYAKGMPGAILHTKISIILFIYSIISDKLIEDARVYANYFECELYGYTSLEELKLITNKPKILILLQLLLYRLIYLKNYSFKKINNTIQIELSSKKTICECKNCGAKLAKKEYFTGICPYCKNTDIFAKVLVKDKFYSIKKENSKKIKANYYLSNLLPIKMFIPLLNLFLSPIMLIIGIGLITTNVTNYNNKEYLMKELLSRKHHLSFELIQQDMRDNIIMGTLFIIIFTPLFILGIKRIIECFKADRLANKLSKQKETYINIEEMDKRSEKKNIKNINNLIKKGFLRNCTLEYHDNKVKLSLAKKLVKDKCPYCDAAIVGAIDSNYKCNYCGNIIMDAVEKK